MSGTGVPSAAVNRLKKDYHRLLKDPVPYVVATPLPQDILTWHYVITGPEDSPYFGGFYHGKLVFPREFPFKPPAIYMITPNGRFATNTRLCLSISDFHPDTWNPAWSASSILTGLLSFMLENTSTSGSITTTDGTKKNLAKESLNANLNNKIFVELFPELTDKINRILKETKSPKSPNSGHGDLADNTRIVDDLGYPIPKYFFILLVAGFGIIVKIVTNLIGEG